MFGLAQQVPPREQCYEADDGYGNEMENQLNVEDHLANRASLADGNANLGSR